MNMNVVQVKFVGFSPIKSTVIFRMKRDNFLSVAIRSFVAREALVKSEIVFAFKDHKIMPGDTPDSLKMKDNDTVEVHHVKTYQAYMKNFNIHYPFSRKRKRFIQDMRDIMENAAASDITIKCGEETFKVHKIFMTSRSSVFKAMLDTEMVEVTTGEIIIRDIDCPTLKEVIHFIYTGELSGKKVDLQNIWYAADKYDVNGLVEELCSKMKNENISGEEVADLLVISKRHNSDTAKKIALKKLKEDVTILQDEVFKARMTEASDVTFSLFQEVYTHAFRDPRRNICII